ncbi:MAG: MerR family transcriptional regulator [Flavobacteriales bacterium]
MSNEDPQTDKIYYSIGEIAETFNVNTSLIRYWEKEFDIIKPDKNKKGNRLFTKKDLDNFHLIYHLVKERGYTLKGAKKKLRENKEDTEHKMKVIERLKYLKRELTAIKEAL